MIRIQQGIRPFKRVNLLRGGRLPLLQARPLASRVTQAPMTLQEALRRQESQFPLKIDPKLRFNRAHSIVKNHDEPNYSGLKIGSADIDFKGRGFDDMPTRAMAVLECKTSPDQKKRSPWSPAGQMGVVSYQPLWMNPASQVLHYGQGFFEGLKLVVNKQGDLNFFRLKDNALRANQSAKRLLMPDMPHDLFIKSMARTVKANLDYVPSYGAGMLYVRPFALGVGPQMGVAPTTHYAYVIKVLPMGDYFSKLGTDSVSLIASDALARAAGNGGTGREKIAGNYAASLKGGAVAKLMGHSEFLYIRDGFVDEAGAANLGIVKQGANGKLQLVFAESPSILPSITRNSVATLVEQELSDQYSVEERALPLEEVLKDAIAVVLTGTAAGVVRVREIQFNNHIYHFDGQDQVNTLKTLYEQSRSGELPDNNGWLMSLDEALDDTH